MPDVDATDVAEFQVLMREVRQLLREIRDTLRKIDERQEAESKARLLD